MKAELTYLVLVSLATGGIAGWWSNASQREPPWVLAPLLVAMYCLWDVIRKELG